MCGAGLKCEKIDGEARCVDMDTHCVRAQQKYDSDLESGHLGMDMSRPVCDAEGHWSPVQCSGSNVCRCVSKTDGEPIFGLETNMTEVDMMTCSCARDSHTLKQMGCLMKTKFDGNNPASQERLLNRINVKIQVLI